MASLRKIKDSLAPDLRSKALAMRDRRPYLQAMGRAVISLGKRAFTDPSLRPSPWASRKDDKPHRLLQKSTMLRKSIRIISVSNSSVTIGSDRPYASAQQRGNKKGNLPPRPYLPFRGNKLTPRGDVAVNRALAAALRVRAGL